MEAGIGTSSYIKEVLDANKNQVEYNRWKSF